MADQDTNWTWNFTGPTTESKAQSRAILPKEIAWELTGVDGNEVGGLRTHPGFKQVTSFTTGELETLVNVFPISVLMDATSFVCGHIYFTVTGGGGANTRAYIHVTSNGTNYYTSAYTSDLMWSGVSNVVTVECIGRFAYIFVKGQTPKCIRITNAQVNSSANFVVTSGGPGTPPVVKTISTATVNNVADYTDTAKIPAGSRNGTGTYNQDMHAYWTTTAPPAPASSLKLGVYGFAVQYMSTVTGRKSIISNVSQVEFAADSYVRLRIAPFGTNAEYDKALIYRTVKNSGVGGTLHLEKTLSLPAASTITNVALTSNVATITTAAAHGLQVGDYVLVDASTNTFDGSYVVTTTPLTTTFTYAKTNTDIGSQANNGSVTLKVRNYDVEVQDSSLVYLDVYIDKGNMDTSMPRGSVAAFMGSTLFVSGIGGTDSATPGNVTPQSPPRAIGDLRWSSTGEIQPENFKPSNRWIPRTPGNEIIGMRTVGNYMMAFSSDRAYRIGRAGQFIKVEEVHLGYGLSGIDALDGVGGMVYFVSGGGMKAISAEGKIDDVAGLDALINRLWLSQKGQIKMAFDAVGQCLTIMKPPTALGEADGAAVCMWFGTNRITELADLPFEFMRSGSLVYSTGGIVQRVSYFYKRNSETVWGVYKTNHTREPAGDGGEPDRGGNLCGEYCTFQNTGNPATQPVPSESEFDCAMYNIATGQRSAIYDDGFLDDDQTWSMAPILFRWVGGNVGAQGDPGQPEFKDFFRQKQLSTCHPYFETLFVDENMPSTYATWRSLAYGGTDETPLTIGVPTDKTGQVVSTFTSESVNFNNAGMLNGAAFGKHGVVWSSLSVGFQCDIVGVDLRLLAFNVVGKVLDTSRRYV